MKCNKFYLFFAACGLYMTGCTVDDIVYPEGDPEVAETYLSLEEVDGTSIDFGSMGSTYVMKIQSPDKWSLSSADEWCTPATAEGFKYTQVSISYSDNPNNRERSTRLTFTLNETGETYSVDVIQAAAESELFTDLNEVSFSIAGGTEDLVITSNSVAWKMDIVGTDGSSIDWCTVSGDEVSGSGTVSVNGSGSTEVTLSVSGNNSGSVRNANVVFTVTEPDGSENTILTVPVSQFGEFTAPVITLDSEYDFRLSWEDIVGLDRYELETYSDESLSVPINDPIEIVPGTTSYDLSNITWKDGYVGMVWMRLKAVMTVEGEEVGQASETVCAHNYFDEEGGDGTEDNPYKITGPRHLRNIAKFPAAHYRQTEDIDMTGVAFEPINSGLAAGTDKFTIGIVTDGMVEDTGFAGVYDGSNHKISNMTISASANGNVALFSKIGVGGVVKNVTIENPVINGAWNVGAIAGENYGMVSYCSTVAGANSAITGEAAMSGGNITNAGGIVGHVYEGTVSHCKNTVPVSALKGFSIGGITGRMSAFVKDAVVEYCTNTAAVTAAVNINGAMAGGICGSMAGTAADTYQSDYFIILDHCYNKGDVNVTGTNCMSGGIIGNTPNGGAKINACRNAGDITAQGSAAGIAARMGNPYKQVTDCLNEGTITSTGTAEASTPAGLVSQAGAANNAVIENCLNVGTMVTKNGKMGGLVYWIAKANIGKTYYEMSDCFALDRDGVRQPSDWDKFIVSPVGYTNISEDAAKDQATFTGWDFDNVWELANGAYPTIRGLLE